MSDSSKVYLDYAATTPLDPRVLDKMLPYFTLEFGNPSSVHRYGQKAEAAVEAARVSIATSLNCIPEEVVFTACGSESDNLALRGAAFAARRTRGANHLLVTPVEHHAIAHTAVDLAARFGFELEYVSVDESGKVDPADVARRIRQDTAVVSIIYANNEIGTINPVTQIGAICRQQGIPFHTDAVQAGAYLPLDVAALQVDLMAIGAHKFYGPKGIGALFIRSGTPIDPVQTGGGQENSLRPGTHNVPYIVGMAEALRLAQDDLLPHIRHLKPMRDRIIGTTLEMISGSRLTGHPQDRLANHASFVFDGVDGNSLLMMLDMAGYACSSGSACKTGSPEPSDVLIALGLEPAEALGSLRITLGRHTTPEQVEAFLEILPDQIARARELNGE